MQYADRTKINAVVRILNLGTSMTGAAGLVGVGAADVTAAKATVDVFVGQYSVDDQALESTSHPEPEVSAFIARLSVGGDGSGTGDAIVGSDAIAGSDAILGSHAIVASVAILGSDAAVSCAIPVINGNGGGGSRGGGGGGQLETSFAHAAASEFH
jgi:hypothetical protein